MTPYKEMVVNDVILFHVLVCNDCSFLAAKLDSHHIPPCLGVNT